MDMRMMVAVRMRLDRPAVVPMLMFGAVDVEGAGAAHRARHGIGADRLIDDLADGAGAAATLSVAAKAAIDMAGRTAVGAANGLAHLVVSQHVAGANDHRPPELEARG